MQPAGQRKGITEVRYTEGLLAVWDGTPAVEPGAVVAAPTPATGRRGGHRQRHRGSFVRRNDNRRQIAFDRDFAPANLAVLAKFCPTGAFSPAGVCLF